MHNIIEQRDWVNELIEEKLLSWNKLKSTGNWFDLDDILREMQDQDDQWREAMESQWQLSNESEWNDKYN